uniref:Uncharacterized protein n=1 Tax=Anguilla anguilla TaxID=7936 RepID=A0A0E9VI75_ANGAN
MNLQKDKGGDARSVTFAHFFSSFITCNPFITAGHSQNGSREPVPH